MSVGKVTSAIIGSLSDQLDAAEEKIVAMRSENGRWREALADIAKQRIWGEISDDEYDHADFEGAYEAIVAIARAALSGKEPANG